MTRKGILVFGVVSGALLAMAVLYVWSGVYDVGADDLHTRPVDTVLRTARDRSIARRARDIVVPDLAADLTIRQGAGNYASMCASCHLAPGMAATELSRGLYPKPPALAGLPPGPPAEQFWVIKHGIKASGMPAWGSSMADEYVWGLVAFLQRLPALDEEGYRALVASSGGHSHGGGETPAAHHPEAGQGEIDGDAAPEAAPEMQTHVHADGTVEAHPVAPPAAESESGNHDH